MNTIKTVKKAPITGNQAGMVSIMVTMILMIVISLLVLGFAQISRRNQRTTLDRQLSAQAFYAAESGINDARQVIDQTVTAGNTVQAKTTCAPASNGMYTALPSNVINSGTDVSYSCLLVNPLPTSLQYDNIEDQSTIIPILSGNGNIQSLTLTWKTGDKNNTTPINGCSSSSSIAGQFNVTGSWSCGYGVLRFDLVPVAGGSLTAGSMQDSTMTTFAIPTSAGVSTVNFGANANAAVAAHCDNTNCSLQINNLGGAEYYMRVKTIYKSGPLQIDGKTTAGTAVQFSDSQIVIDVTGKAQDVLRRLQVRVPARLSGSQNQVPDNALESNDSVCKRFSVMDNYYTSNVPGTITGTNVLCQP